MCSALEETDENLNLGFSLLTTPTSISDALKSAVNTDERHIMASYKYIINMWSVFNINERQHSQTRCMLSKFTLCHPVPKNGLKLKIEVWVIGYH